MNKRTRTLMILHNLIIIIVVQLILSAHLKYVICTSKYKQIIFYTFMCTLKYNTYERKYLSFIMFKLY